MKRKAKYDQVKLDLFERKIIRENFNELKKGAIPIGIFLIPYIGYSLPLIAHFYPTLLTNSFLNEEQKKKMFAMRQLERKSFSKMIYKELSDDSSEDKSKRINDSIVDDKLSNQILKNSYLYLQSTHSIFRYRFFKSLVRDFDYHITNSISIVMEDDNELITNDQVLSSMTNDLNHLRDYCEDRGIKILQEDNLEEYRSEEELKKEVADWLQESKKILQSGDSQEKITKLLLLSIINKSY